MSRPRQAKPESVNIVVRFPPDVHAAMVRLARADGRSLNSEAIEAFRAFIASRKPRG